MSHNSRPTSAPGTPNSRSSIGGAKPKINIFDLTQLIPITKEVEYKRDNATLTEESRKKLLANYTEVTPEDWHSIEPYEHIRYMRKDGQMRKGGYVKNQWLESNGRNAGNQCMQLINKLAKYNTTAWTICFNDIEKIWIRGKLIKKNKPVRQNNNVDEEGNAISNSGTLSEETQQTLEFMTKQMDMLKTEVTRLSNEQKRIINLIRKLHNIKSRSS
jgi:hypothetical protein